MHKKLKSGTLKIIDFLLPPQCPLCKEIVSQQYTFCKECWPKLYFITSPKCSICSVPLVEVDQDMPCENCLKIPPIYTTASAPLVYNDYLKKLILRFKNYDSLNYTKIFTKFMLRCMPKNIDFIIPVPLHWWRFIVRQYNQSAELAKELSKQTKIPCELNLLKRHKSTASQGHKNKIERYNNLKNAFSINKDFKKIKNAKILLIDDVLTSGATANACAKILKQYGAESVHVLTIARVEKVSSQHLKKDFS